MIKVERLNVKVGDFRLKDVSLEVERGNYCTLLGPSGAGKSVFLEALAGLRPISNGLAFLGERDVTGLKPEDRQVAYVPQDLALFPHLDVIGNIEFGAKARKLPGKKIEDRLDKLAKLLDIRHLLDRRNPMTLSIGERQRVAIARALMVTPEVLLLDEPFSALDSHLRRKLQLKLREINRELCVTILHVTHDREEAFILGDHIAIMIDGSIIQAGCRDEIYYRPATVEVARFLLNRNIFSGWVADRDDSMGELSLASHGIKLDAVAYNSLKPGQKVHFGIRPEEIMVIRPDRPLSPQVSRNLFKGRLTNIFEKGGAYILWVDIPSLESPLEVDIPTWVFRDLNIREGNELLVSLKMNSIWSIRDDSGENQ